MILGCGLMESSEMNIERAKGYLKRYRVATYVNEKVKCYASKRQYNLLCQRYETPSILTKPAGIKKLGQELWQNVLETDILTVQRPRALFVGTDWEQDSSGIIQGLSKVADVTLFEQSDGCYGQQSATSLSEVENVRRHNGDRLLKYLKNPGAQGPFNIIIGQMWGFKMYWRSLAEAREMGVAVVNIAMDDRHAFVGRRLDDGTLGGTLGLAPYLSLACTDAPECVKWYEAEGCTAIYLPEASDPDIFRPIPGPKLYDVCFVGANYGIRAKLVVALERAGIKVQTYGKGWPNGRIPTDDVPQLFARSRIVLGCGTIGYCDDFLAIKLRDFDGPMSGSLYMTHDNPDLYHLFSVEDEIVTFGDIPEAVEKAKYFLSRPEEREKRAYASRLHSIGEHKWVNRFYYIFSKLSEVI